MVVQPQESLGASQLSPLQSKTYDARRRDGAQGWDHGAHAVLLAILVAGSLIMGGTALAQVSRSPVQAGHIQQIRELLRAQGLGKAAVVLDERGRVELQGAYNDEREVERAFSLAQTVVGPRWVSPIIPQRIRVKAWMQCLENLFAGKQCGPGTPPPDPNLSPPGPLLQKHALVVGVGDFQDERIRDLQFPAKDAKDVYNYLVHPRQGNFRQENVVLLQNARATRNSVVTALQQLQTHAAPDDLVFVYLSSHGTPPDKFGGVHVITYDAVVHPRDRIWQTSVSEDVLREFIQEVRAKRLVIVLDACYSNGAYAHVPGFLPVGGKSLAVGDDEGYGRSQRYMVERLLGLQALSGPTPTGARSLTAAASGWGKVLISSSDAGELSWESSHLGNGIFTYYFLEGLVRMQGNVKRALDYARPLIRQQVKHEKGPDTEQRPQTAANPLEADVSLTTSK